MNAVQKIECKNKAWFVMSFNVTSGPYTTASTGDYPSVGSHTSRTIDLAASTFSEGVTVWPVVSAVLGKTQAATDQLTFAMNGKTAIYEISGTTFDYSIKLVTIVDGTSTGPAGFPANIPVNEVPFINWDQTIDVPAVWACAPRTGDGAAAACNWAAQNGYTVRPRGIMHGWSPLSVTPGLPSYDKILLIDTTKALNSMSFIPASGNNGPAVKVGAGATMGALMQFLEQQPGGKGAAPGYSFPHIPAPDHLTVGGVLAINGHGTAVPTPPNDDFATTYGSMSNRILSLTAIVTDPGSKTPDAYQVKTFERGDKDITAFMTQLGAALVIEVTLQVIDNYNMRCQSFMNIDSDTLFKAPNGNTPLPNSCADFLNKSGRVEIIWFPFTSYPWLKVWTVEATKPAASIQVNGPNNYPFSDNLPNDITKIVKTITSIPGATVIFGKAMETVTRFGLEGKNFIGIPGANPVSEDIWGASKNTLFYVKDTTLRVTANGYAVLMNKSNVQQAVADFATQFETMLANYRDKGIYPVNSPLEIRVTGLDSGDGMPSMNSKPAGRPVISGLATDAETVKNNWDVALWFDVLTLPGTPGSNAFYEELEAWFLNHFTAPAAKVVPEWSKGWAYTDAGGAWTSTAFMNHIREAFTTGRDADDNWAWQKATLAKYDAKGIFRSHLLNTLFEQ
jgi:hypothetical protein